MANNDQDKRVPLIEIKRQLEAAGLKPVDFKHLNYEQLKKLVGLE